MRPFPFQRLLVVNSKAYPDAGLLEYAAMLASCSDDASAIVAGARGTGLQATLAPVSQAFLAPAGIADPTVSLIPDLNVDTLFAAARDARCDLMVLRRPRGASSAQVLLRHLLCLAPCPVCLVPEDAPPSLTRPLVRLSLTARGARLLALAASVTRHAGGEELIAAHNVFDYEVDEIPDLEEKFRTAHELEIYRFLARADLSGVNCTPVRASSPSETGVMLKLAKQRGVDLVILDPGADGGPVWQWNRREARKLAELSPVPVLATGLAESERSWGSVLRDQVFTEMEPKFN
jgi:hypothetical protein